MDYLYSKFGFDKDDLENEINTILKNIYSDHAILRRYLADYRYLDREKGGSIYKKTVRETESNKKTHLFISHIGKQEMRFLGTIIYLFLPTIIFQQKIFDHEKKRRSCFKRCKDIFSILYFRIQEENRFITKF